MSLTLIKSISNNEKKLSDISGEELEEIIRISLANSDFSALKALTNHYTGIYDYDEHNPYWLKSDFSAPTWVLSLRKSELIIEWSAVTLDDGLNLTHPKHQRLLNTFKYWVTAIGNPHENGGRMVNKTTIAMRLNALLAMINAILLQSENLQLSKLHLTKVNEEFWIDILQNIVNSGSISEGIYGYTERLRGLLVKHIDSVDDKGAALFAEQYPFVARDLLVEEQTFRFTVQQRVKACYWLHQHGFYQVKSKKQINIRPQYNSSKIKKTLFDGKIIPRDFNTLSIQELWLKKPKMATEYNAIANKNDGDGFSESGLQAYIEAIKIINSSHGRDNCFQLPIGSCKKISLTRIGELAAFKKASRTRTLPPTFVFNLIRQCYEFTIKHQISIFESVYNVLQGGQHKSSAVTSNPNYRSSHQKGYDPEIPSTELGAFIKYDALALVDERLIKLGVTTVSTFKTSIENRHQKIRDNESLFELYNVLMGSLQVLVGAIMGRRQDELVALKGHGNLHPNVNPFSVEGLKTDFELVFKVKKTGIGGKNGTNATIKRPLVNSIARLIWTLEQFNHRVSDLAVIKGNLSLFNNLDSRNFKLFKVTSQSFNAHFDAVCDYFETDLVQYENGEYRRNYVRQHQLRRFFAMCFFWSKGFDGLDSLRWMLGHSDLEHLYHYISESETGAVLNGAKASVIVRGITDKNSELAKLENIDKLEALIAKRFGVQGEGSILISTLSNASEDYDSEDYNTIPSISQIQAEQELESQVITLLEGNFITLEPNFFTVQNESGETINTFTLALEVKELD